MEKFTILYTKFDTFIKENTYNLASKISNSIQEEKRFSGVITKVQTYFTPIVSKIKTFFIENLPNLSKLIQDLLNLLKANKIFLWWLLRMYTYVYIILYLIGFYLILFSLLVSNGYIAYLAKAVLFIFKCWSAPISQIRSKINYILSIHFKILGLFSRALLWIWSTIVYYTTSKKCAECMGNGKDDDTEKNKYEESKSTKYEESKNTNEFFGVEENCFQNRLNKAALTAEATYKFNSAAKLAAMTMDLGDMNEERPDKVFKEAHKNIDFMGRWNKNNIDFPCPSWFNIFFRKNN